MSGARDFIIIMEPGMSPQIKRPDAYGTFGTVVMLQLLADDRPEGTRFLVATVPSGGNDLWVESSKWHLDMFKASASRKTKREVKERLARERALFPSKTQAAPASATVHSSEDDAR